MPEAEIVPGPNPFRPVPTACRRKVGLDIGTATTVCREAVLRPGARLRPSGFSTPTLVAHPGGGEGGEPGRAPNPPVSPLALPPPGRAAALLRFAESLRARLGPGEGGRPWGVVACPAGADATAIQERRAAAGILFERFLVVEESSLIASGILHLPMGRHVVVVDIGASGVRASLVGGTAPASGHLSVVPHGGKAVDGVLRDLLARKHPDLFLSGRAIERIKEVHGFVRPAEATLRLELVAGGARRMLDITDLLREACETVVPPVLRAIREVLSRCPSDHIEEFLASILIVGGGAALRGLPGRLQEELERDGVERAKVHFVGDPRGLIALGALKRALVTPDDLWEVPLFTCRPAA